MPPSHRSAARLIGKGFYDGLRSFAALEERIATLTEEIERGDAFEVFVEGYLATQALLQADCIWVVGQVPLDVRRALNLPSDAKGIDGVFRTRAGMDIPYQVKFRIGRPVLGFAEVAPFHGVTERTGDRLLITNADSLANDIENRDGMRTLRGTDCDDLTAVDLAAITDWLNERPVRQEKKTPRDDQRDALRGIATALAGHDRATVVMACAAGKTLVQLWAAERRNPHTVLVLVPSLSLIQQSLAEWSHETQWGERFQYLCVCSDPTVTKDVDPVVLTPADLSFPVKTDPEVVRAFLTPRSLQQLHYLAELVLLVQDCSVMHASCTAWVLPQCPTGGVGRTAADVARRNGAGWPVSALLLLGIGLAAVGVRRYRRMR